jgi:hypothetical protein
MSSCFYHAPDEQKDNEVVVHKAQSEVVTLANGEKWKVIFATNKGITKMRELMTSISNNRPLNDYRELGAGLQKEFQHNSTL